MNNKKIGLFIASLRKDKGLTQKELADKLYISDQAVSKWERGLSMPDVGLLGKLSEYLDVSVSEILKGERIKDKKDKNIMFFKNKIILSLSIIFSILIILYILGTIDYIRSINNKEPIFIYHRVNTSNSDVDKLGKEYYGIGYKITICDNNNKKYIFQLGHKQKLLCYAGLTCSETNRTMKDGKVYTIKNDKRTYNFSFFNDRLYLIDKVYLIPTSSIQNENTWSKEMLEYYDTPGIHTTITKINDTTYEMKQTCNITEILRAGLKNKCTIDYYGEDIFGLTKNDIQSNYYKDACK